MPIGKVPAPTQSVDHSFAKESAKNGASPIGGKDIRPGEHRSASIPSTSTSRHVASDGAPSASLASRNIRSNLHPTIVVASVDKSDGGHPTRTPDSSLEEQYLREVSKTSGVSVGHLPGLQKVAAEMKVVIGFRPVNNLATGLIERGCYTKDMGTKPKSADWGPFGGYLPVDQKYSKLEKWLKFEGAGDKAIQEANDHVQTALAKGCEAMPLRIDSARLEELKGLLQERKRPLSTEPADDGSGSLIIHAKAPSGRDYVFYGKKVDDDLFEVRENSFEGPAVEVLGKRINGELRAITADYDLLFIAPRLEDFSSHNDRLPQPEVRPEFLQGMIRNLDLIRDKAPALYKQHTSLDAFYAAYHPVRGNVSQRDDRIIDRINVVLDREDAPVVHHGADDGNPGTVQADNYPALIILPEKLSGYGYPLIFTLENEGELSVVWGHLKEGGYHPRANPGWNQSLLSSRRPSFSLAMAVASSSERSVSVASSSVPSEPEGVEFPRRSSLPVPRTDTPNSITFERSPSFDNELFDREAHAKRTALMFETRNVDVRNRRDQFDQIIEEGGPSDHRLTSERELPRSPVGAAPKSETAGMVEASPRVAVNKIIKKFENIGRSGQKPVSAKATDK